MKLHKHYDMSEIFSTLNAAVEDNENKELTGAFVNFEYLSKKSATFNAFSSSDLYLIIDLQNAGELVFEKNISLKIGDKQPSVIELMQMVNDEHIKLDAIIDFNFVDYHMKNKINPLELILSVIRILKSDTEELYYVQRSIAILTNDSNGLPKFGLGSIKLLNEVPPGLTPDNFNIKSMVNQNNYARNLTCIIREVISR